MSQCKCSFCSLKWRSKTKNFLSIFCRLPPHPPPRKKKKGRKNFGFFSPDPKERTRRATAQSERTRQFQATTRSARAKWVRAKANTSPQLCAPTSQPSDSLCCYTLALLLFSPDIRQHRRQRLKPRVQLMQ